MHTSSRRPTQDSLGRSPPLVINNYGSLNNIHTASNLTSGINHGAVNQCSPSERPRVLSQTTGAGQIEAGEDGAIPRSSRVHFGFFSLLALLRTSFPLLISSKEYKDPAAATPSLSEPMQVRPQRDDTASVSVPDWLPSLDFTRLQAASTSTDIQAAGSSTIGLSVKDEGISMEETLEPLSPVSQPPPGLAMHEVYVRSMLCQGQGLACWEPRSYEPETQPEGVIPGDVGTYTTDDGFQKIFNLWDDMDAIRRISQTLLSDSGPHGLGRSIKRMPDKLDKGRIFACGASVSVIDSLYEFHCSGTFGAILAVTSPASKEMARDNSAVHEYLVQHAEAIYRHALSQAVGRVGSLYVITSCIKAESWAIAAYNGQMAQGHDVLQLAPRSSDASVYGWTRQGSSCSAHSGRSSRGVKDQSLFLQGFKLAPSAHLRSKIEDEDAGPPDSSPPGPTDGSTHPEDGYGHSSRPPDRGFPPDKRDEGPSSGGAPEGNGQSGRQQAAAFPLSPVSMDNDICCTPFPEAADTLCHPSDVINAYLLQSTGCDIAITHDDCWRFLFKSHSTLPISDIDSDGVEDLRTPVEDSGHRAIFIQNGVACISPNVYYHQLPTLHRQPQNAQESAAQSSTSSADAGISHPLVVDDDSELRPSDLAFHSRSPTAGQQFYNLWDVRSGIRADGAPEAPPEGSSLEHVWDAIRQQKERRMAKVRSKVPALTKSPGKGTAELPMMPQLRAMQEPRTAQLLGTEEHSKSSKTLVERETIWTLKKPKSICNMRESTDGGSIVATFEFPVEVAKSDIHVNFQRNRLELTWEVTEEEQWMEDDILHREKTVKKWHRTIPLPDGTKFEEIHAQKTKRGLVLRYPNMRTYRVEPRPKTGEA
ncbi:hypothetical protein NMY22_g1334 [Coprinellus aureogranulatus]|nr:hypothetical protein NMY22_g1334 [Coprinellus aureogranulatus]